MRTRTRGRAWLCWALCAAMYPSGNFTRTSPPPPAPSLRRRRPEALTPCTSRATFLRTKTIVASGKSSPRQQRNDGFSTPQIRWRSTLLSGCLQIECIVASASISCAACSTHDLQDAMRGYGASHLMAPHPCWQWFCSQKIFGDERALLAVSYNVPKFMRVLPLACAYGQFTMVPCLCCACTLPIRDLRTTCTIQLLPKQSQTDASKLQD